MPFGSPIGWGFFFGGWDLEDLVLDFTPAAGNHLPAGEKAAIIAAQKDPMNLSGAIAKSEVERIFMTFVFQDLPRLNLKFASIFHDLQITCHDIGIRWTRIADI